LCAVAEDNPEVGESITLAQLAGLPWATYQRVYDAPVTRQQSLLGIEARVQVSVDSFQALSAMVAGTENGRGPNVNRHPPRTAGAESVLIPRPGRPLTCGN
jgi:hypothetical protein